jgi:hypothetical protein
MRASKARAGRRTGKVCHRRWSAYGKSQGNGRRNGSPRSSTNISVELLRGAFFALKRDAAAGVDGLTWQDYEADLDRKIEDLHARVHRGAYRALPSRRHYIPKADGQQRPLAIAALEDKIVQKAVCAVLNAIYEEDFLGFSYGFRPKRSQHDALDALITGIHCTKVNYIFDADLRSFFDCCAASRAIVSVLPPAPNGTTMVTGLEGQSAAAIEPDDRAIAASPEKTTSSLSARCISIPVASCRG